VVFIRKTILYNILTKAGRRVLIRVRKEWTSFLALSLSEGVSRILY